MLTGGLISVTLYLLFLFLVLKKLYRYKRTYTGCVLASIIFVYFLSATLEVNPSALLVIPFALADRIDVLVPNEGAAGSVGVLAVNRSNRGSRRRVKLKV